MNLALAAILGVVEGLTEFLPVSSTGHLILAEHLLQIAPSEYLKSFDIAIQLGAIFAVVMVYWRSFFDWEILKRLVVGFLPTGVIGLLLYKVAKAYLLGNDMIVVVSLAVGGVLLIAFEKWKKSAPGDVADVKKISYRQAFVIGLCQSVAIVPGVSRSGASVLGGLAQGIDRKTTVQFSFLLAVPTLAAATGLDLLKNYKIFLASDVIALGFGTLVAFVVALGAIRFLLGYVRNKNFVPFGIYRIIIAAAYFALMR
jgi:undecaprenyl-diphosphatase